MHKKKPYLRYQVTPEIDSQIKTIAEHLPPIQELNPKGEPLVTTHSKYVSRDEAIALGYTDLPPIEFFTEGKLKGQVKPVNICWGVPRYRNHYLNMFWKYREFGDDGVAKYVDEVNKITEDSKAAAETIRDKNEIPEQEPAGENGG